MTNKTLTPEALATIVDALDYPIDGVRFFGEVQTDTDEDHETVTISVLIEEGSDADRAAMGDDPELWTDTNVMEETATMAIDAMEAIGFDLCVSGLIGKCPGHGPGRHRNYAGGEWLRFTRPMVTE